MRVLVAGGGGFLGSHVVDALVARGDHVVVVDDFSTGHISNLAHHADGAVEVIRADIADGFSVRGAIDAVMNLASPASPKDYLERPLETLRTGSEGTHRLLQLADTHQARFLQASTSEVYGDPEISPQPESYWGRVNPVGPRSVYDEAKRYGESLVTAYQRLGRVTTSIARIFNTYGPRLAAGDGRVVSNFIVQALAGQDITIYGTGEQTRSLCYVDDQVRGLLLLLDSQETGPINIGSQEEISILELAGVVIELTGSRSRLSYKPLPADDPRQRRPDTTLAEQRLEWLPQVGLREGLGHTIDYFRQSAPL